MIIGDIVIYRYAADDFTPNGSKFQPAIVTKVLCKDSLNLVVFNDSNSVVSHRNFVLHYSHLNVKEDSACWISKEGYRDLV